MYQMKTVILKIWLLWLQDNQSTSKSIQDQYVTGPPRPLEINTGPGEQYQELHFDTLLPINQLHCLRTQIVSIINPNSTFRGDMPLLS